MRIFVTGASGFIGSAVVRELLAAGHSVVGLARSDEAAKAVEALGAEVHRGSLQDLDGLKQAAAAADGVAHLAFNHDFSKFAENAEDERHAITALGDALAGSNKPLVITSGIAIASGQDGVITETTKVVPGATPNPRGGLEDRALELAERGVRVSILRLPPSVHGDGDKGFVPMMAAADRQHGVAAYVGEGANRWPAVHRLDAARLYRLALEKGVAGTVYHAVGDEGVAVRDIAAVIGRQLDLPVKSLTPEEGQAHFGWFGMFAGIDCAASAQWTGEQLGWAPQQPGLLEDIDRPAYFGA